MMTQSLDNVFGAYAINNHLVSYVDRGNLDSRIERLIPSSLKKVIVIRGLSKQGKTTFHSHNFKKNVIVIDCRPNFQIENIYNIILAHLGAKNIRSEQLTTGDKYGADVKTSGDGGILGVFKIALGIGVNAEASRSKTTTYEYKNSDDAVRFIVENGKNYFIVIDHFHVLSKDTQRSIAQDLRSLSLGGCKFIISGTWDEQNKISSLNKEMYFLCEEMLVFWSKEDLRKVLDIGQKTLNIEFSEHVTETMINYSLSNISILQEMAKRVCAKYECNNTQTKTVKIDNIDVVKVVAQNCAEEFEAIIDQTFFKALKSNKDYEIIFRAYFSKVIKASKLLIDKEFSLNTRIAELDKKFIETLMTRLPNPLTEKDLEIIQHDFEAYAKDSSQNISFISQLHLDHLMMNVLLENRIQKLDISGKIIILRRNLEEAEAELISGIDGQELLKRIKFQPKPTKETFYQLLECLSDFQIQNNINPFVVSYDLYQGTLPHTTKSKKRLRLVDYQLLFCIRLGSLTWPWED